jgi:ADYC domain
MRALLFGLLIAGCADQVDTVDTVVEPEDPDERPVEGAVPQIHEEDIQCRDLLGADADKLTDRAKGEAYASFPLVQTVGSSYQIGVDGRITPPAGTTLNGRILVGTATGGGNVKVKFVGEAIADPPFGVSYKLQYQTASGGWLDYCAPNETATALKGLWKTTAFRIPADEITFGCSDSAMRKCYGFGYAPDDGVVATNDYDKDSVRWRAHQACTRMARADYCGVGEPGTRPGTRIVIRDNIQAAFNPPPRATLQDPLDGAEPLLHAPTQTLAPPDQHYIESAWTWRENWGAVCMERERWKSLAPTSCPNLADPRVDPSAKFCIEMSFPYETSSDLRLINGSKSSDLFLNQWMTSSGETVATARGFWRAKVGGGHFANPPPFPTYNTQIGTDGILLRNPPVGSDLGKLVPVFSTQNGSDRVLAAMPWLTTDAAFEGYVLTTASTTGSGTSHYGIYERRLSNGTKDTVTGIGLNPLIWSRVGWLNYVFTEPLQTP